MAIVPGPFLLCIHSVHYACLIAEKMQSIRAHRQYTCKICRKVDRKGRLAGHILKYHIPMDRVPFSCSLCNFRCIEKAELLQHVTGYQRHKEELKRCKVTDQAAVLHRSTNPMNVEEMMLDIDESSPARRQSEEPVLPDWLGEAPADPDVVLKQAGMFSPVARVVREMGPQLGTPMRTPAQPLGHNLGLVTLGNEAFPILSLDDHLGSFPNAIPEQFSPRPQVEPESVLGKVQPPPVSRLTRLSTPTCVSSKRHTATLKEVTTQQSLQGTPLQDEFILDDILDEDPLLSEIMSAKSPATATVGSQTVETSSSETLMTDRIVKAIEANGRHLINVNRNLQAILEESIRYRGAIVFLERSMNRRKSPPRRPRSPLFAKENVRSTVKKVRKN